MNTKNKHFSYINTGTLHWGNPNLLNNSKKRRGAILSSSSSHLPFLPLISCPLTCSQPRALALGWDQLFSASAYPTPRVVSVYLILLCNPFSGHPLPGSLGLVASPPSIWPPNRFPAQAKRPWPQGGRLRPHPAPSPAPPPHSAERIG